MAPITATAMNALLYAVLGGDPGGTEVFLQLAVEVGRAQPGLLGRDDAGLQLLQLGVGEVGQGAAS